MPEPNAPDEDDDHEYEEDLNSPLVSATAKSSAATVIVIVDLLSQPEMWGFDIRKAIGSDMNEETQWQ